MHLNLPLPFAQIGGPAPSIVSLIMNAGLFAKAILLLLAAISVLSWAIIYDRIRLYRRLIRGGRRLQQSLAGQGLKISPEALRRGLPSLEGALVMETKGYLEGNKGRNASAGGAAGAATEPASAAGDLRQMLERRATAEISEMEKYLIFLATTAGTAPFLGLLGTVWGIMSSFLSMGVHGSASIEVVGPGIAEALITTIAGLGAAIPALVGYNLLVRHVRRQETGIELFISRLLELANAGFTGRPKLKSEASYEKKSI